MGTLAKRLMTLDELSDCLASRLMFFVPFGIWVTANLLTKYSVIPAVLPFSIDHSLVRLCCLACLLVRELLFGRWDRLAFLGLAIGCFMAYMSLPHYLVWFDTICFVFSARNIPFRSVVKFTFALTLAIFLLNIVLFSAGVLPDTIISRGDGTPRHHLGFNHPNNGPGRFFFIFCAWSYLRGEKYGFVDALIAILAAGALFAFTGSRTACSMTALLAIILLLAKRIPEWLWNKRVFEVACVGVFAVCCAAAVALAVFYDPSVEWLNKLNSMMSGRLYLGHKAIEAYGIPLFHQSVDLSSMNTRYDIATTTWVETGKETVIVDSEYVKMLEGNGLIFLVLETVLSTCVAASAYRKRQWNLLAIIAAIAIFEISETYAPYAFFNSFVFLFGKLFYSPEHKSERPEIQATTTPGA